LVLIVWTGVWVGALALGLFAKPRLDVIYGLKERRPVVKITEEISVGFGAHDRAADDATPSGDRSKGGDAIEGDRCPTEHLAIDDDGQSANDAAGNLGKGRWDEC
jgi:hypothetical protein